MNWQSWSDFWYMGGYALYVWGSMAVVVLLMVIEVWQARAAREQTWQQLIASQHVADLSD